MTQHNTTIRKRISELKSEIAYKENPEEINYFLYSMGELWDESPDQHIWYEDKQSFIAEGFATWLKELEEARQTLEELNNIIT